MINTMKLCGTITLSITLLCGVASSQEVFDNWLVFPGPNPSVGELVQDISTDYSTQIGHIIFDYPNWNCPKSNNIVSDIAKLPTISQITKLTYPNASLISIFEQQRARKCSLVFDQLIVRDCGTSGLIWYITYNVIPQNAGGTGPLTKYHIIADGTGNLIPPRMTLVDAIFHSPNEGWTCSTLCLSESEPNVGTVVPEADIQKRATKALADYIETIAPGMRATLSPRLVFQNQTKVDIPIAVDSNGELVFCSLWAVNFSDAGRSIDQRPHELFSIWVTLDGQVASLRRLPFNDVVERK